MGRKEQLLETIFRSMRSSKEVTATSRRYHVATSPSHDVGSTNCRSQQFSHVATSPRRDVITSRHQLENLHLIIKCQTARKFRASGSGRPEREIGRVRGSRLREISWASYRFPFLFDIIKDIMMFLRLSTLLFTLMMF